MHHPLGKEPFQAHVIVQDHLQERALGERGERMGYTRDTALFFGGQSAPSWCFSQHYHPPVRHLEARAGKKNEGSPLVRGARRWGPLTLMGPSRMICPSLAMLSYSWMAARR